MPDTPHRQSVNGVGGSSRPQASPTARPTRRLLGPAVCLLLAILCVWALRASVAAQGGSAVSGVVLNADGSPAGGARVRIQATQNVTTTAADGTFHLLGLAQGVTVTVSAWGEGSYCAKVEGVSPPAGDVRLTLRPYQTNDNPAYQWLLPIGDNPTDGNCASCKRGVYDIWIENDAHARSTTNPRFLSMYNGTDTAGNPGVGPGYAQDFPGTAGNCATCHAPGAAIDAPFTCNMNQMSGANLYGVHCDFCHKVAGVYLNPATGLPYPNAPGVISMDVRRPFPQTERYQLFFGSFDDDNVPLEDTYLPLMEKSQYCAPCHQFSFWGTPIYQSFKEWKQSAYPAKGIECQTCHMPSDRVMTNVAPGTGGVERDPLTIHAHTMPGAGSVRLLQRTLAMTVTAQVSGTAVLADVAITNVFGGHHVPTDYPGRNMLLLVHATDAEGRELAFLSGPVMPEWGGAGSRPDDYAGRPGKGFAKVLRDALTGEWPVVNYWKQCFILSDNRIAAGATDVSHYAFTLAAGSPSLSGARIHASVVFRRLFIAQAREKGWDSADVVMAQAEASVP